MKKEEIKKSITNIVKIWNYLDGDYKVTFLKELIEYKKDGQMDTSLLAYIVGLPEAKEMTKCIQDLIS
jgi:phage gp16-like protein